MQKTGFKAFKAQYENKPVKEYPNNVVGSPVASVCVITYNHIHYIRDCLDGILAQRTDFPFEILLGDDDSLDGTREVCREYAEEHPDKVRLFLHHRENNIKIDGQASAVFTSAYNAYSARGKYIALCEGDDYWMDPCKLQKQIDIIESRENCTIVSGGFKSISPAGEKIVIEDSIVSREQEDEKGFIFTLEDQNKAWLTKTVTVLYRNIPKFYEGILDYKYPRDTHIYYHLLKLGEGYYMKQVLGVYNVHGGGAYSSKSQKEICLTYYRIHKELYERNQDVYTRAQLLEVSFCVLKYKVSSLLKDEKINTVRLWLMMLRLVKTKGEFLRLIKYSIPMQIKNRFRKYIHI
jgi:glycosyltransferase involved in cell wall biosynthesis